MKRKPIIAIDLETTGKGGGPYTSNMSVMNSNLNLKYEFKIFYYGTELGRGISIKRIKDLVKQLNAIKPDLVHYSGLQLTGFHIAIACKLAGIKNTVVTVHGFSGDAIGFNFFKRFLLTYLFEPITLLLAKRIIGVSEYVISRRVIQLLGSKRSVAIYNFPPKHIELVNKNELREELGLKPTDVLIVSVARIVKDKGYHILDEAILKFKNHSNLKFVIVGDGSYLNEMKEKLKKQVDDNQVFFLGHRDDISRILSSCNIFVLPTLHETLSIALLEASQASLALIASETGGVPEIVKHEYNGLLVLPGSVKALEEAIERVSNYRDLREKFGNNSKMHIQEKFTTDDIEYKIDKIYQSLLKK